MNVFRHTCSFSFSLSISVHIATKSVFYAKYHFFSIRIAQYCSFHFFKSFFLFHINTHPIRFFVFIQKFNSLATQKFNSELIFKCLFHLKQFWSFSIAVDGDNILCHDTSIFLHLLLLKCCVMWIA